MVCECDPVRRDVVFLNRCKDYVTFFNVIYLREKVKTTRLAVSGGLNADVHIVDILEWKKWRMA